MVYKAHRTILGTQYLENGVFQHCDHSYYYHAVVTEREFF